MDVTPGAVREVQFHERWRGYDVGEVDRFLEEVAAGLEAVQAPARAAEPDRDAPARVAMRDELARLEAERARLFAELDELRVEVRDARARLHSTLADIARRVDGIATGITTGITTGIATEPTGQATAPAERAEPVEPVPAAPAPVDEAHGEADDDFFAALRGALDSDEPLGPRDDPVAARPAPRPPAPTAPARGLGAGWLRRALGGSRR
jgi:DivIVA domain-containing protein